MSSQKHQHGPGCQGRRGVALGVVALGVVALGLTVSRGAEAQEAAGRDPWRWYRWQALVTDGAGVALFAASGAASAHSQREATGLIYAGAATLVVGGPIVHAAHGRWGAAAGSLALRVGLPALALLALNQPCEGECGGQLLLGVFAFTAPVALDAAALSWERAPAASAAGAAPRLRIQPYASDRRKQFNAGLVATF